MSVFRAFADRHRILWVSVMSVTAIVALFMGILGVADSDLFMVRAVEVVDASGGPTEGEEISRVSTPLDAQQILDIAQVPTESTNLFSLKLSGIEKRLLAHRWIKGTTISKRFPQTVSISVVFREPVAMVQNADGALFYLDSDGTAFAPLNLKSNSNLPVLVNFPPEQIGAALRFVKAWEGSGLELKSRLSALEWDDEKGLQVMATYALPESPGRVRVELGLAFSAELDSQLGRLKEVITYLSANNIRARQVNADLGKKIVVRIARSS